MVRSKHENNFINKQRRKKGSQEPSRLIIKMEEGEGEGEEEGEGVGEGEAGE
jgi:hypothetical protein